MFDLRDMCFNLADAPESSFCLMTRQPPALRRLSVRPSIAVGPLEAGKLGMSTLRGWFRSTHNRYLVLMAAIFLLSLATFHILFFATNEYFREIVAALIGVSMAAVVTRFLLDAQSDKEEGREKNVEVFRTKLAIYRNFIKLSVKCLEDKTLEKAEMRELLIVTCDLSLVSSADTTNTVMAFIREQSSQTKLDYDISEVLNAFRLDLNPLDEFDVNIDMKSVTDLISGDLDHKSISEVRAMLEEARSTLISQVEKIDGSISLSEDLSPASGVDEGEQIDCLSASNIAYSLYRRYNTEPACSNCLEGWITVSEPVQREVGRLRDFVRSLGFTPNDADPDQLVFNLQLVAGATVSTNPNGSRIWAMDELAEAIVQIERFARLSPGGRPKRKPRG